MEEIVTLSFMKGLDQHSIIDVALDQMSSTKDMRLKQIMEVVVRHFARDRKRSESPPFGVVRGNAILDGSRPEVHTPAAGIQLPG